MGHASRMTTLANELAASGAEVMFSSSGEVTKWLLSKGFRCNDLPLVDVVFTDQGAFSATATLNFFPKIMTRLLQQVRREVANLSRFGPDVVLSDSVASTLVAARLLGIRSVAVLNQLRLISSPRTPKSIASVLTAASVAAGSMFWNPCDEILIPDLPPPYTISESNLWNAGPASSRAKYIGFLTPRWAGGQRTDGAFAEWKNEKRKRKVYWQISGPPATRMPFLAKALAAAEALSEDYLFVVTAGNPTGTRSPAAISGGYLYQWCDVSEAYIETCDVVVSRAGHVSISDYILRAKPSLLVPIPSQSEQIGNASKAQRLGVSISADEAQLDPRTVLAALVQLESGRFATRGAELKKIADQFDALGTMMQALSRP